MKINRDNYEAFFLDFHEGNLDKNSVNELMDFLASNPDLREEFEGFQNISLSVDDGVRFGDKESLKRNAITIYNYKTWLVAFVENDLDVAQRIEVEEFLERNPVYKAELTLLNQTKLLPETDIRFKNKSSLKKGSVVIPMWVRTAAAAAVVMGILAYWFTGNENVKHVAVVNPPKTEKQEVKTTDSQIKVNPSSPENKSSTTVLASIHVKKTNNNYNSNTPHTPDPSPNITAVQTTKEPDQKKPDNISVTPVQQVIAEEDPSIVINSTMEKNGQKTKPDNTAFVALDDSDLVELGLKANDSVPNNNFIRSAVKNAGTLFGINVTHSSENNMVMATHKETFALGKIQISRTVLR